MNTCLLAGGFGFPVGPLVAADGTQGSAYPGQTFTATGGTAPYTYSSSSLPPGLSINSTTGAVTGTPTVSGVYHSRITATDATGRRGGGTANFMIFPSFAFSNTAGQADDTLTVGYNGNTYTVLRPLVVPYNYTATKFVSTTGSDSNNGTSVSTPWRTIGHAALNVVPGDVVQIADGVYAECPNPQIDGTSGSPIVWTCAAGHTGKVIIAPPQSLVEANYASFGNGPPGWRMECSYNVLNGLAFQGYMGRPWAIPSADTYSSSGVTFQGRDASHHADHCTIQNCGAYQQLSSGLKHLDSGNSNMLSQGNFWINIGPDSREHGDYVTSDNCTIQGNVSIGVHGYAVHYYPTPNLGTITKNVAFSGFAGILLSGSNSTTTNNTMAYSTVNDPQVGGGYGIVYFQSACIGNNVNHNISANNLGGESTVDAGGGTSWPSGNTDDNNDYYPLGIDPNVAAHAGTVTNVVNEDPLFLNPTTGDFRVGANSPDIGRGAYPNYWASGITMTPSASALPDAVNGQAYSQTLSASGTGWTAPATWSLAAGTTLPAGLTLNATTGVISGTPTGTVLSQRVAVQAVDSSATPKKVCNVYYLTVTPTVYVYDKMTGVAGTMAGRTPDTTNTPAGTWSTTKNTAMDINGSGYAVPHAAETEIMGIPGSLSDCRVSVDTVYSTDVVYVTGRDAGGNSQFQLVASGSTLELWFGGTRLAQASYTWSVGTTYTLELRMTGSTIYGYVNGVQVIGPVTSASNQTTTRHGFGQNQFTSAKFTNFKITAYS